MSNKTVISVKVDKDVRDKARKVAKKIGVPLSMVVNQQLKEFAARERIEFEEPLMPNAKTRRVLDKAIREIRAGDMRNFSPGFTNMTDAIAWLNAGTKKKR
jgi:antitoxin component of RelBE/YafQ-DinJ toxin-antitoxin module